MRPNMHPYWVSLALLGFASVAAAQTQNGPETPVSSDSTAVPASNTVTLAAEEVPPAPAEVEVTVQGPRTGTQQLIRSADAVTVIEMRRAQEQTADLGEVLARSQGLGVRREGGLGSDATISLNGLQGDQVRVFVDGVPLELAGYPFDLVNIPVNIVERVEVYHGVVPVRLGADALGGAINVVTDQSYETHAGASYQVGSFGIVRVTGNGRYRHEPTGLIIGATGYADSARNDFWMDDRAFPLPGGRTEYKSVRRFHDAYHARGGNVEVGVVDKPWARKLLLQGFVSSFEKQLQHNADMTRPFGEITYGGAIYGLTARHEVELSRRLELESMANYSHRTVDFQDLGTHIYGWDGQQGETVGRGPARGELYGRPIDESRYEDTGYGRVLVKWNTMRKDALRASVTPYYLTRIGDDHVATREDLLRLRQRLFQVVSGVEYEINLLDDKLSNVMFGKDYYFNAYAEDHSPITAEILERRRDIHRLGGGNALRYRFADWLLGKASYEYATRLPRADELFGDGALVESSTNEYVDRLLTPEVSHNANLGARLDLRTEGHGTFVWDTNAFLRESRDMIVLLLGKQFTPYANMSDARTLGVENGLSWSAPTRWLRLEGTFTWQDVRNTSTTGPFATQRGKRIPTRPYLFASWGARLRFEDLLGLRTTLEPYYSGRYVHSFDRGWDISDPTYQESLPYQVTQAAGTTWTLAGSNGRLTSTLEVDNLANAKLYDVFGVQRPGRSFSFKLTGQM